MSAVLVVQQCWVIDVSSTCQEATASDGNRFDGYMENIGVNDCGILPGEGSVAFGQCIPLKPGERHHFSRTDKSTGEKVLTQQAFQVVGVEGYPTKLLVVKETLA